MRHQVVILAAGRGTRLGRPHPKPLTQLADGRTILGRQLDSVAAELRDAQVYIVVGYKLEMILEAHPGALFVYNEAYDETNTSQSLLRALRASGDGGVLWLNGDVVLEPTVLRRALPLIAGEQSFVAVCAGRVGDEEVKYRVDAEGWIAALSKELDGALGEAVGLNYVSAADKPALVAQLSRVCEDDYFERGMELAISEAGVRFAPLDVSDLVAFEVDTVADLNAVNAVLACGAGLEASLTGR